MALQPQRYTLFPYTTLFRSYTAGGRSREIASRTMPASSRSTASHVTRVVPLEPDHAGEDRKSTRLNSSHTVSSYAVFCLEKKRSASSMASSAHLSAAPPERA